MTKTTPLYVVITAAYPLRDFDRIPMPEAALFLTKQGACEGFVRIADGLRERYPGGLFSYGLSGGVRTASVAVRKPGTVLGDGNEWRPVAAVVLREYQTPAGLVPVDEAARFVADAEQGPAIAGRIGPVEDA